MGFGVELLALNMEIDLLIREAKSLATATECLQLHAEHVHVEIGCCSLVDGRKDQVVEMINHMGLLQLADSDHTPQALCAVRRMTLPP